MYEGRGCLDFRSAETLGEPSYKGLTGIRIQLERLGYISLTLGGDWCGVGGGDDDVVVDRRR